MKQKTVVLAGIIGLIFGFLFSATLGVDFFGSNDNNINDNDNGTETALKKDEEGFKSAYNLSTSIYKPITGDMAYDKIDADETFILYIGRDTCPYCQQFVPKLQDAAVNEMIDMIYHVDSVDKLNKDFVSMEGINTTPTTYIIKDGEIVQTIIGFRTTAEMETILQNHFS